MPREHSSSPTTPVPTPYTLGLATRTLIEYPYHDHPVRLNHSYFASFSHSRPASSSRGHGSTSSGHHQPTNTPVVRLAIPYSTSLPSLRQQAQSGAQTSDQPAMVVSVAHVSPTRGMSPSDLQNHLYQSFLTRKTADVALRIRGSWCAIYRLHRVVLIQAGYFQSLFTAGFAESKSRLSGWHSEPDVIDIVLDDHNITREAFEVCVARLYGGGPLLHLSPSLIPTPSQPLTTVFDPASSSFSPPNPLTPDGHQPATPRFLLSLLATASFLGMPAVTAHALQLVLMSVGPHTAVRYLNFAIGKGVGLPDTDEDGDNLGAVGLEDVAEMLVDKEPEECDMKEGFVKFDKHEKEKEIQMIEEKLSVLSTSDQSSPMTIKKEAPASPKSDMSSMDLGTPLSSPTTEQATRLEPHYYYGAVSDKVGEAAACWLARWSRDILTCELGARENKEGARVPPVQLQSIGEEGKERVTRKRGLTAPPRFAPSDSAGTEGSGTQRRSAEGGAAAPVVWRRGGLNARWIRGLLSSDALFVRGERERYEMAKSVVELRRATPPEDSEESAEEMEWEELFRTGIYYENMILDDMVSLSKDISPTTGLPYVPLSVLQSAHWNQDVLRHRITSRRSSTSPSSPPVSPSARDKELGLSVPVSDLDKDEARAWFPVPGDSSARIGDIAGIEGANTEQQLLDLVSSSSLDTGKKGVRTCEANFFGLQRLSDLSSVAATGLSKLTPHPPFRFGVEFWDIDSLKEKNRLHSHTVWYAGSLFNVYVQVVRKKGVQLGVYLHRQSSVDPLPPFSAPAASTPGGRAPVQTAAHAGRSTSTSMSGSISSPRPSSAHYITQVYSSSGIPIVPASRSTTPLSSPAFAGLASSLPSSSSSGTLASASAQLLTLPATAPATAPQQPYRDPRAAVSAYFAISCSSATGASLTRFTSAPDVFSVSQSWGWKSSSLRSDEYLEVGESGLPQSGSCFPAGKEVSLRATIVIGVV